MVYNYLLRTRCKDYAPGAYTAVNRQRELPVRVVILNDSNFRRPSHVESQISDHSDPVFMICSEPQRVCKLYTRYVMRILMRLGTLAKQDEVGDSSLSNVGRGKRCDSQNFNLDARLMIDNLIGPACVRFDSIADWIDTQQVQVLLEHSRRM